MRKLLLSLLLLAVCGPDPQAQFERVRPALEAALAVVKAEPNLREVVLRRDEERRLNGTVAAPDPDTVTAASYPPRQPERELLGREEVDPDRFRTLLEAMDTSAISRVWRGDGFVAFTTGGWIDAEVGFLWVPSSLRNVSHGFDPLVQVAEEWYWFGLD